jgi:putative peptidoglycan lipid II flippase
VSTNRLNDVGDEVTGDPSLADGTRAIAPAIDEGSPAHQKQDLGRHGSVVASMTFLSRISGLVRDMVVSYFFGATPAADAFFVAFRIPNFFRRLFAEGAFSQAFVPVLAGYRNRGPIEQMREFVAVMGGNFIVLMSLISLLGVVAAPLIVVLFAPGFSGDPVRLGMTADMLRITFPYLGFISLTAFAGSLLNSFHRYAIPAFTPVWLNVTLIVAALFVAPKFDTPVVALAWGVFAAGLIQLLFQIPALRGIGMWIRPRVELGHPGVRRVGRLMVPAIFAGSVSQINALVDTMIASLLASGSISWLYYSDRLMEMPIGIVAVTIATVLLPNLSRLNSRGDTAAFGRTVDWGVRTCLLFGVPAAAALYVLSLPLMATVFFHGAMTAFDVVMASLSLKAFSVGLLGFCLVKVAAPAYFACEDTRTPFRIAVVTVVLNVMLSLSLFRVMGHVGVAFATTIAAVVQSYLLLRGTIRRGLYRPGREFAVFLAKVAAATVTMIILLVAVSPSQDGWLHLRVHDRVIWMTGLCALGGAGYFVVLLIAGMRPRDLRYHV